MMTLSIRLPDSEESGTAALQGFVLQQCHPGVFINRSPVDSLSTSRRSGVERSLPGAAASAAAVLRNVRKFLASAEEERENGKCGHLAPPKLVVWPVAVR